LNPFAEIAHASHGQSEIKVAQGPGATAILVKWTGMILPMPAQSSSNEDDASHNNHDNNNNNNTDNDNNNNDSV
jgi:hypothetical protein